jgi:hypothetical protein
MPTYRFIDAYWQSKRPPHYMDHRCDKIMTLKMETNISQIKTGFLRGT